MATGGPANGSSAMNESAATISGDGAQGVGGSALPKRPRQAASAQLDNNLLGRLSHTLQHWFYTTSTSTGL